MPINVLMPALSPTMTEGKLAKWVKQEGDTVAAGDVLVKLKRIKPQWRLKPLTRVLGKIIIPG